MQTRTNKNKNNERKQRKKTKETSHDLMEHRQFFYTLAVISVALFCSRHLGAQVLKTGNIVSFRCLGDIPGPRYLDGRTANGTVGLAPNLGSHFTGTKWLVVRAGDGVVALKCLGNIEGPRWLDGRTADGTTGLAPNTNKPFTGTRWQVVHVDNNNPDIVELKCLGDIEGPTWLDGRTADGSVGLAPMTRPPFTGTKWEVFPYN